MEGESPQSGLPLGLRPPGNWGGREASGRTSIKDLRPPKDWGGQEASERTSICLIFYFHQCTDSYQNLQVSYDRGQANFNDMCMQ